MLVYNNEFSGIKKLYHHVIAIHTQHIYTNVRTLYTHITCSAGQYIENLITLQY